MNRSSYHRHMNAKCLEFAAAQQGEQQSSERPRLGTTTKTKKRDDNATSAPRADEGARQRSLPALASETDNHAANNNAMRLDRIGIVIGKNKRQHVKRNNNTHGTRRNIESKPMNRSSHVLLPNTNGASAQIIWSAQFILGAAQSTCHLSRLATQGGATQGGADSRWRLPQGVFGS